MWEWIVPVFSSLGGLAGVTALLTSKAQNRKTGADTAQVVSGTALAIINPLREELTKLSAQLTTVQAYAVDLEKQLGQSQAEAVVLKSKLTEMSAEIGLLQAENARLRML